jgi:hypothetical protein
MARAPICDARWSPGGRDQGPVAGTGWTGHRYSFEIDKSGQSRHWAGTVDVDQQNKVRQLDLRIKGPAAAGRHQADFHEVIDFSAFGTQVGSVAAPPASDVFRTGS